MVILLALGLQAVHQQRGPAFRPGCRDAYCRCAAKRAGLHRSGAYRCSRRPIKVLFAVIDAAAGQKTQQALVLLRVQVSFYAALRWQFVGQWSCSWRLLRNTPDVSSSSARAGLVAVNDAPLTFAGGRYQHLFNNFGVITADPPRRSAASSRGYGNAPSVFNHLLDCRSIRSSSIIISIPSRSAPDSAARYSGTISIFANRCTARYPARSSWRAGRRGCFRLC